MTPVSRFLLIHSAALVCLLLVGVAWVVVPLARATWRSVADAGGSDGSVVELREEATMLRAADSALALLAATPNSTSARYDFLQGHLAAAGVGVTSMSGQGGDAPGERGSQAFELTMECTCHQLGSLLAGIENGPYAVSVSAVHAVAEDLLQSHLKVNLTVAFCGGGE